MPDYIIRSENDKAQLWRVIEGLAAKPWRVSITAYKSRRSNDQNRLAWKLYNAVAAEMPIYNEDFTQMTVKLREGALLERRRGVHGRRPVLYRRHPEEDARV